MQWTPEPGGGFTTADPAAIVRPFPKGAWSPKRVNVADQRDDLDSLYSFVRHLVRCYRECPELGWGTFSSMECAEAAVFAHRSDWEDRTIIAVHNLSPRPITVELTLDGSTRRTTLHGVLEPGTTPVDAQGRFSVDLDGYGYRWLRYQPDGSTPI
jgi:glycosidase